MIFESQQLDIIYAQFGILYDILPDVSRSNYDPRKNLGPHVDGIVGSANVRSAELVTSQLKELSLNKFVGGPNSTMSSTLTLSVDVHSVQSSTNPNGNLQPGGNKKKGRGNNCKGGKNNNKPKDNDNNEKLNNNFGEGKKERWKVNFPCKICTDDHLTHLCPKIVESVRLLSLLLVVLTNPFPHNQHMDSSSSNAVNAVSGSQNPPMQDGDHLCINMVKSKVNVATQSHVYSSSQIVHCLESTPPPETHLKIQKTRSPASYSKMNTQALYPQS
jgi:hypothetical protein